jgi:hypothetical protein
MSPTRVVVLSPLVQLSGGECANLSAELRESSERASALVHREAGVDGVMRVKCAEDG